MNEKSEDARDRVECRECGCQHFEVTKTITKEGKVRRRRKCRHCGRPLFTREIPESVYKQLSKPDSEPRQN